MAIKKTKGGKIGGLSKHPDYNLWTQMKARCRISGLNNSKWYFDKGITVCDRWLNSFPAFLEDMGPRPTPKHSIDRIKSHLGYEPSNCRWATWEEQMNNVVDNAVVEYIGVKKTLSQWARELGIKRSTLGARYRSGYEGDKLFFVGKLPSKRIKTATD